MTPGISSPSSLALQMTAGSRLFHQTPGKPEPDRQSLGPEKPFPAWMRLFPSELGRAAATQETRHDLPRRESAEGHPVNHLNQSVVLLNQGVGFNLPVCLWILDNSI